MAHDEITELFKNFSLSDIESSPAILQKIFNLLNNEGTLKTLPLVKELIAFLVAHDNDGKNHFVVECQKLDFGWKFTVSEF
jgi:hypothetical protein